MAVLRALAFEPESCAELAALKEPLLASACWADAAALNESDAEPLRWRLSAMLRVPCIWLANWFDLLVLFASRLDALNWPAAARLRELCSLEFFDQLFASFELQRLSNPDALLRVIWRLVESSLWLDDVAVFAISVLFSVFVESELLKADARCSASWCARWAALVKFVALSNIDAIDSSIEFEVWLLATSCSTLFLSSAKRRAFEFAKELLSTATKLMKSFEVMSKMPVPVQSPVIVKPRAVIADFASRGLLTASSSPHPATAAASIPRTTPLKQECFFMTVLPDESRKGTARVIADASTYSRRASGEGPPSNPRAVRGERGPTSAREKLTRGERRRTERRTCRRTLEAALRAQRCSQRRARICTLAEATRPAECQRSRHV